jgi:hypothetical protein
VHAEGVRHQAAADQQQGCDSQNWFLHLLDERRPAVKKNLPALLRNFQTGSSLCGLAAIAFKAAVSIFRKAVGKSRNCRPSSAASFINSIFAFCLLPMAELKPLNGSDARISYVVNPSKKRFPHGVIVTMILLAEDVNHVQGIL